MNEKELGMYDIIDQIHYDHISMSKVLHFMEQEIHKLHSDMTPDYDVLVDGMRYMIHYSDAIHHPKEDSIFDQLSEKAPDMKELIADIRRQHETIAEMSAEFYEIVKKSSLGEFVAKDEITQKGHDYIGALRKHMNLEEGDLLRQARKSLTDTDFDQINQRYANNLDPLLSSSLEREYNALYQCLVNG